MPFDDGLRETVDVVPQNEWWWRPIKEGDPAFRSYYEAQYGRAEVQFDLIGQMFRKMGCLNRLDLIPSW